MIGQEKIDYGYEDKTNIYIGPNFDIFFGVKFLNSISIDAGFYFIVLAGSDILPNDNGFRINLRIWQ